MYVCTYVFTPPLMINGELTLLHDDIRILTVRLVGGRGYRKQKSRVGLGINGRSSVVVYET